jgi:hypothetical protein
MTAPITHRPTERIYAEYRPSAESLQKMKEEIAYAKNLEVFVHGGILPKIKSLLRCSRFDQIARHDLQGLEERIFACIAAVEPIIDRHVKNTDHVDLLLNLITRENRIFTNVLWNGTARGKNVRMRTEYLIFDGKDWGPELCKENVAATICIEGRLP